MTRLRDVVACATMLLGGHAFAQGNTIPELDPFLDEPVIWLPQGTAAGMFSPMFGVLVMPMVPTEPGQQVFVTTSARPALFYGFDGDRWAPISGMSPLPSAGSFDGRMHMTGVPTTAFAEANPGGLSTLPAYELYESHGTGVTPVLNGERVVDARGVTRWTAPAANSAYGPLQTPATAAGPFLLAGTQQAALMIGEEDFKVRVRASSNGAVLWTQPSPDQQVWSAAVRGDPRNPASSFVVCQGRGYCVLSSFAIATGEHQWTQGFDSHNLHPYVAVGELDGLPGEEVVTMSRMPASPWYQVVWVLDAATGDVKWEFNLGETAGWGTSPALADLDDDGRDEIIVQADTQLHVLRYAVGEAPGWPVIPCLCWGDRSEPLVADLDGDNAMEIVSLVRDPGTELTQLSIFDDMGRREFFPTSLRMYKMRYQPAIADIDGDGHNELLIGADGGFSTGTYPTLWSLDFSRDDPAAKHGAIAWGQFGADAQHTHRALPPQPVATFNPTTVAVTTLASAPVSRALTIGNLGRKTLTWFASEDAGGACAGGDVAWLEVIDAQGSVAGRQRSWSRVSIDAAALAPGHYSAAICVTSSDPAHPAVSVPIELDVVDQSHAVVLQARGAGTVEPPGVITVAHGARFEARIEPLSGYRLLSLAGCAGTRVANRFRSEPITSDCTLTAVFEGLSPLLSNGFE